jgi:hypothetical protein
VSHSRRLAKLESESRARLDAAADGLGPVGRWAHIVEIFAEAAARNPARRR